MAIKIYIGVLLDQIRAKNHEHPTKQINGKIKCFSDPIIFLDLDWIWSIPLF